MLKQYYKTFGSLKLAVVLLASLAGTLIFSTFYESKTSTRDVQMLVYQSPWFIGLLCMLGVNVFAAAMVRYPWKGYQTGFVVTHLGIIVLLIGSIIGLIFGVEGSITMTESGPPRAFLVQDFEVVQVLRHGDHAAATVPLRLDRKALKPGETRQLHTAKLGVDLALKAHHPNTREELIVKDGGPRQPAVKFTFSSKLPGMEQSGMQVTEWLVAGDPEHKSVSVNPAVFKIETAPTAEALATKLQPPAATGKGTLTITVDGNSYDVPVEEHLTKPFKAAGGKIIVSIEKYYAELRIVEKQPVSVSEEPNNPAVFFTLETPKGKSKGFAFADYPDMTMLQAEDGPDKEAHVSYNFNRPTKSTPGMGGLLNTVTVIVSPDDKLYYTSQSAKSGFHSGPLQIGVGQLISSNSPIQPEIKILEFHPNPIITSKYVPASTNETTQFAFPAIELEARAGGQSTNLLIRWGEPGVAHLGGTEYELTYGWNTVPLDFSVQLEKFEMPNYEGTDMPAGYESYVKVRNAKSGEEFSQKIWMNHPMTYRGYRISQASFDRPADGGGYRSTLQVLKDPGWFFKWTGSLLIVSGIVIMFYIKPYFKGLQKERARRAKEAGGQKAAAAAV